MVDEVRVVVVDDDPGYREAIADAIASCPGFAVVDAADGVTSGFVSVSSHRPDALVLDARMPDGGGERLLRELRTAGHDLFVLVLSAHDDPDSVARMLDAGADLFLAKGASVNDVLIALNRTPRRATPPSA